VSGGENGKAERAMERLLNENLWEVRFEGEKFTRNDAREVGRSWQVAHL